MHKEHEYKEQGDGSDSWTVSEYTDDSKEELINRYMVYEDPTDTDLVDWNSVDFSTCPPEKINILKTLLGL